MLPAIPIALGALIALAYWKTKKKPDEMTQEQKAIYDGALTSVSDPAKLNQLAEAYAAQGFDTEAAVLQKRADLYGAPPEVKAMRRDAFRKGMSSQDPNAINAMADAFEAQTATGSAGALRDYADALQQGVMTVQPPIDSRDSMNVPDMRSETVMKKMQTPPKSPPAPANKAAGYLEPNPPKAPVKISEATNVQNRAAGLVPGVLMNFAQLRKTK